MITFLSPDVKKPTIDVAGIFGDSTTTETTSRVFIRELGGNTGTLYLTDSIRQVVSFSMLNSTGDSHANANN